METDDTGKEQGIFFNSNDQIQQYTNQWISPTE
jgi:hypothetical protein